MWPRSPLIIVILLAAIVVAALYVTYRLVDPLPPRHFAIAAGTAGSGYDNFARQYARILARQGVELEIRNSVGAVENLALLRDPPLGSRPPSRPSASRNRPMRISSIHWGDIRCSDIYFLPERGACYAFCAVPWQAPFDRHAGNCATIAYAGVLKATDALDASTQLLDPDYTQAIDALIAGEIDVVIVPQQDLDSVQHTLGTPGIRLMSVAQAEAIAKAVPGLKHVVLWRGLLDLSRDLPNLDVDLLASRNRVLVRKDLHPALQYLLLEAMRKSTGQRAPSIASVNSRPSNPMICPSLQRLKPFTARAQRCGNGTLPSGLPRSSIELHSLLFRSS